MQALHRKLLRDLGRLWSQVLTIALVVASGVGGFLTTLSAVDSLASARDRFYLQGQFADVFATLKRAPQALLPVLHDIPGVADVQATTQVQVRIEVPGVDEPLLGELIGVDRRAPQRLNRLTLREGRGLEAAATRSDRSLEALVSAAFADAHGLRPGARLRALVNGRVRDLTVVGIALSPEYVFAGLWGMPDQRGFGVLWVDRDALAAAYDMASSFNQVAIKLAPGADEAAVRAALTRVLAPYGAFEATGREDQTSNAMLDNEIKEQHVIGTVLPSVFLMVATFLLNVVISRLIATQREQIATLKALGYGDAQVARHYLQLVLVIVCLGCGLGVLLGEGLGQRLTGLYAEFFRFPDLPHRMPLGLVLAGVGISLAAAGAGTLATIAAAVALPPAEAMRPPAPTRYRRALVERLTWWRPGPAALMMWRSIERRPWRTALTLVGLAAAVAIVILGYFFRDAIDRVIDTQFALALRGDVVAWTTEPTNDAARHDLEHVRGVTQVESMRMVPVTLVNGPWRERSQIRGYEDDSVLYRVIDQHQRLVPLRGDGLVLTDRLADKLGLHVGDRVRVEVLEGRARTLWLPVDGVVREMMGLNAYMRRSALNHVLGEGDVSTGFVLRVAPQDRQRVLSTLWGMPRVAGAFSKATMLANMQDISARNIRIMSTILTMFAVVVAVGVVYNNARIALAERTWELASLRVLGMTQAEVSALLLGEMGVLLAAALPLGMVLGWGLVHLITGLLQSDQFDFPVVILPATYAWAALTVVVAAMASAWVVRRRINRLDMVAALKTRE